VYFVPQGEISQYGGERYSTLIETDGLVFDEMEEVTIILQSNRFSGTPPVWMTAAILRPYLKATDDIKADFVKPSTVNHAKSSTCLALHKTNYYAYEKAMKKIAEIYAPT
jgi:hypothetical protein